MLAALIVLILAGVTGVISSQRHDKTGATTSSPAPEQQAAGQSTAGPSENALPETERQKLVGSWQRADANYVLEINRIAPDGQMDAAYLNPQPIHVSKAQAGSDSGKTMVMLELRDRLYPGSYYTLTYNAGDDRLSGVYHHLGVHRDFDVVFTRREQNR
jgi:hypothetical protein